MLEARFTIRFRRARTPDRLTVVIEDEWGSPYLFSRLGDRFRLKRLRPSNRALPGLVSRGWHRIPEVSPYSLTELRRLLA